MGRREGGREMVRDKGEGREGVVVAWRSGAVLIGGDGAAMYVCDAGWGHGGYVYWRAWDCRGLVYGGA